MAVSDYAAQINAAGAKYGVDPQLIAAVMQTESGGNPNANSGDAQGLMQLTPSTAAGLGVTDPFDPAQSIDGGAHYLAQQLAHFDGNASLAIAAYNAGPGNVDKYGLGALNVRGADPQYLAKVMALWKPVSAAVAGFRVGDSMPGTVASTVFGQNLGGSNNVVAMGGTTKTSADTAGGATPGFFGPVIDAANSIATEVFLGAAALALLSGGILWLASTDSSVRGAVKKAAA